MLLNAIETTRFVSMSALPRAALVVLSLLVVVGTGLAWQRLFRERSRAVRAALLTLRGLAGLAVLFFLLEPGVRRAQYVRVKSRLAVVVDRSASMNFPANAGGASRNSVVTELLKEQRAAFADLASEYAVEMYGAEPELVASSVEAMSSTPPAGKRTDLLATLRQLKAESGGGTRALSGVVLLSDGADNASLAHGLTADARKVLASLEVPVSTVSVGSGELKDLAIESLRVNDFAFVRNSVKVEVDLRGRGFAQKTVPLVLRNEGRVLATEVVTFTSDDELVRRTFSFSPSRNGRAVYTVSTPISPEEVVTSNNTRSFTLKVIRDRLRVLLVAGRPTWDERALRGVLVQDPNIDLVSFYILRDAQDRTETTVDSEELALIPFPRDEIFREKLKTFDVVLILNFSNPDPQVTLLSYRSSLSEFVRQGGGLAYIGGDRSFGEAVGPSAFDELLPLVAAGPANTASFQAQLTPEGVRHPITAIGTGGTSSSELWAALPELPGMNFTRAQPDAVVLLAHPTVTVDGKPAPVIAVQEVGLGRTMAIATDGTWTYWLPAQLSAKTGRVYERLWSNALRWLVRDPELSPLSIVAEAATVEPGQPIVASVIARSRDYSAAAQAEVEVDLVNAEGGGVVTKQKLVTDADGAARVEFPPAPEGAYHLVARATHRGAALGEASDAVAVRSQGVELLETRTNSELLAEIAKATGGTAFSPEKFSPKDVPLRDSPLLEAGRSSDVPLWNRWYWLAFAIAVMGIEWALQRRYGYV